MLLKYQSDIAKARKELVDAPVEREPGLPASKR